MIAPGLTSDPQLSQTGPRGINSTPASSSKSSNGLCVCGRLVAATGRAGAICLPGILSGFLQLGHLTSRPANESLAVKPLLQLPHFALIVIRSIVFGRGVFALPLFC